jgi:hypothetical protein
MILMSTAGRVCHPHCTPLEGTIAATAIKGHLMPHHACGGDGAPALNLKAQSV